MSDFNPKDLLIDGDTDGAVQAVKSFLGIREEQFRCNKCNAPCTKSHTHSVATAAFTQGEQPSWYCEACDTHYYREPTEGKYTVDMYDR
jgi:uncharacterized protein with PIN domain